MKVATLDNLKQLVKNITENKFTSYENGYEFIKEITIDKSQLTYELANYDDYKQVRFVIEKTYVNSGSGNCWIRLGNTNLALFSNVKYANIVGEIIAEDKYIEINQSCSNNLQTGQNRTISWRSPAFTDSNNFLGQKYNLTFSQEYIDTFVDSTKIYVYGIKRNSEINNVITSDSVSKIQKLTQEEYDALNVKENSTLYIILENEV